MLAKPQGFPRKLGGCAGLDPRLRSAVSAGVGDGERGLRRGLRAPGVGVRPKWVLEYSPSNKRIRYFVSITYVRTGLWTAHKFCGGGDLFDRDDRNSRNTESDRRARQAEARANEPAGITADPVFKQGKSNLEAIFAQDPLKNIDRDLSFRTAEALLQYHLAADEFRTANPNATLQEKLKFTSDIVGALSDGFSSNLSGKTSQQVIDASPGVQSGDITPISELVRIPLIVITSSGIMISDSGHRDHPP